jgi:biopolymer transport protein ExbB
MESFILGLLALTSIVSIAFIVERGWALRTRNVIPTEVESAVENCRSEAQLPMLEQICRTHPSTLSRLIQAAISHLHWPKGEMADMLQTRARHEITQLERGLVVLEIATGIAPLLGLVGTVYGMIELFGAIGQAGLAVDDPSGRFAQGIALALRATLMGLLIAIPSLAAWSFYNRRVETFAVEMELLSDEFLRRFHGRDEGQPDGAKAAAGAAESKPRSPRSRKGGREAEPDQAGVTP